MAAVQAQTSKVSIVASTESLTKLLQTELLLMCKEAGISTENVVLNSKLSIDDLTADTTVYVDHSKFEGEMTTKIGSKTVCLSQILRRQ
jgi:hypothetical protein